MREVFGTNRNVVFVIKDGYAEPMIEFILYAQEKQIESIGGDMVNAKRFDTIRFGITPDVARETARVLIEAADEADKQAGKLRVEE